MWLFLMTVYIIKKLPVPTKRAKIFLLKVKSCNAFFRMLLVCISSYLKSVLKYKFWVPIIQTLQIYVSQVVWIRGYFSTPNGVRDQKSLGNTGLDLFFFLLPGWYECFRCSWREGVTLSRWWHFIEHHYFFITRSELICQIIYVLNFPL